MHVKKPADVSKRLIARAQERAANPQQVWGLSWGEDMPRLNEITGGIQEKTLTVLISRPAAGKSSIAAKWGLNAARTFKREGKGLRVRIATLEMSAEAYQNRMGSFLANVPLRAIRSGHVTRDQLLRYQQAQVELGTLPIDYLDGCDTIDDIERFVVQGHDAGLFILDHIGIAPGFVGGLNSYSSASGVSIRLSKLAHTQVASIILGHQNRQSLSSEDKRPTQESVAGSDQITRDADLIVGLFRPDMFVRGPDEEALDPKTGELLILKNRDGAMGTVHMIFDPRRTDWKEVPMESKRADIQPVISAEAEKEGPTDGYPGTP